MRISCVCSAVVAVAAMAGSALGANLVSNGSFENPGFTGGSDDGGGVYFYTRDMGVNGVTGWEHAAGLAYLRSRPVSNGWVAQDGDYYVEVESGFSASIMQSFATEVGATYELSFAYAANPVAPGNDDAVRVLWNGSSVDVVDGASSESFPVWTLHTYTVVATSTMTTLSFEDAGLGAAYNGGYLDNVSVTLVPAPGGAALLGLALVGAGRRRR